MFSLILIYPWYILPYIAFRIDNRQIIVEDKTRLRNFILLDNINTVFFLKLLYIICLLRMYYLRKQRRKRAVINKLIIVRNDKNYIWQLSSTLITRNNKTTA